MMRSEMVRQDEMTRLECLRLAAGVCEPGSHHSQVLEAAKAFEAYIIDK